MQAVELIFLNQANIQLTCVGPVKDVVVASDLGDPLVIDEPTDPH
jgi:hypothetical protein